MPVIFLSGVQTLQGLWGIVEDCFQFPMISHSSKLVICYRRYVLFKFIIFFQLMSKELMPVIFLSGVQTLQRLWGIVEDCFQFPMISHSSKLVICYRRYVLFKFIIFFSIDVKRVNACNFLVRCADSVGAMGNCRRLLLVSNDQSFFKIGDLLQKICSI